MKTQTWMRWTAVFCAAAFAASAEDRSAKAGTAKESCGKMISENAKYPEQLKATLTAVADSWEQHAQWTGTKTPEAKAESETLRKLAKQQRQMAKDAEKMAQTMRDAQSLADAPHDMQAMPSTVLTSMEKARDEQRKFGNLLLQGAAEMDRQIQQMKGVGGSGAEGGSEGQREP